VKAKMKVINDSIFLSINNFHLDTVYIIGYGEKSGQITDFKTTIEMSPFQKSGDKKKVLINKNAKYLFIQPQNRDSIIKIDIE
jgi:hypothetical protein